MVPDERFDAYPERQFAADFINVNSSGDHCIWSIIKTLLQPCLNPVPRTVRHGLGITAAVSASGLDAPVGQAISSPKLAAT